MDTDYLQSKWSVVRNGTVYYLEEDMVDSLPIANSPFFVATIIAAYLLFVTKLGPRLMENQKPYSLKKIMQVYNLVQVVYNLWLVSLFFRQDGISYMLKYTCHPPKVEINPRRLEIVAGAYYYFLAKVADLSDTIFMVLRKKFSHITFLHLFHHTTMVLSVWVSLKYIRGEPGVILGVLNATVHVIMYTYYFLATFGAEMQKYLWWKRYLTQIQIGQFIIALAFIISLFLRECTIHPYYTYMWVFNCGSFLILFLNFYVKSYKNKKAKSQ